MNFKNIKHVKNLVDSKLNIILIIFGDKIKNLKKEL